LIAKYWDSIQDKIDWDELCHNPNAIPLIAKYWDSIQDRINWDGLSINPDIFIDEYEIACRQYFKKEVWKELMEVVWHPRNADKFDDWLGEREYDDDG